MPRRVNLPGADELFRARRAAPPEEDDRSSGPTGRVRHDEKITVYVSTQELLELEQARLSLRAQGLSADRGRLVREAIDMMLADLRAKGPSSSIVARLGS
ncbi:hypothetical protein HMPREF1531_02567 [Propionibacterium sp. oral taxon 192 str. F0372]|mgnify:CR=1 FL=1|uniref:hypothetical protein n=1 Tax=Propionibacterium sp. oral taxon 192 TaxID=671222 RepID=UPI000353ED9E|nr:hypothetical protein [Propionibacterium sp. oral taxon 192]EPH00455.1 hypothetical protein HMPREF1531_02567 [Propionibacterium sp. oral taxon 192 str. F0372]